MKKRKIWTALNQAAPRVIIFTAIVAYAVWIVMGFAGGFELAKYMQWPRWVGECLGIALGGLAGASPPAIFFGRRWWQDLEPTEPPEILRRRADRHDEKSGAISEAPSTGGEISEVKR